MPIGLAEKGAIRVGVLRGGPSSEYEISLLSGANVLKNLPEQFIGYDVFISKDGLWHWSGVPRTPERVLQNVDLVFNSLHGQYGEDGKVQSILERFKVPYTGSKPLPAALAMNKVLSKRIFKDREIKTPVFTLFHPKDNVRWKIRELFQSFPQPSVIKPFSGGSSIGLTLARTYQEFEDGIRQALLHGGIAMIEEYIPGKEVTVSVVQSQDGDSHYSLFPIEIIHGSQGGLFDFDSKYERDVQKICPADSLSRKEKAELQRVALEAHNALGLRHYSNADLIVHPTRGIYLLEVNALPGITQRSLLPISLRAADISLPNFLEHILTLVQHRP